MSNLWLILAAGCLLSAAVPSARAQSKAQVMVVGTYHMDNPGQDLVKSKITDVLSPTRQKEITDLLTLLKRFKPTKIAIEAVDNDAWNKRYSEFLGGTLTLGRDERHQIAFRLAKELGHPKIYAVDAKLDMEFDKPMGFLAQHNKPELDRLMALTTQIGPVLERIDQSYTVSEIFAINNSDRFVRVGQGFYMSLLSANDGKEFPGADMVGDWYKRNLRIFSRIQTVTKPGDRVLVLIGSGHVKYLRDIIKDSDTITDVSPMKFLPKVPASVEKLLPITSPSRS